MNREKKEDSEVEQGFPRIKILSLKCHENHSGKERVAEQRINCTGCEARMKSSD